MTRVIDASVACKWFFNETLSAEARRLAASDATFVAPDMILAECANAAWRRVRDGTVHAGAREGVPGLASTLVRGVVASR